MLPGQGVGCEQGGTQARLGGLSLSPKPPWTPHGPMGVGPGRGTSLLVKSSPGVPGSPGGGVALTRSQVTPLVLLATGKGRPCTKSPGIFLEGLLLVLDGSFSASLEGLQGQRVPRPVSLHRCL